MRFSTDTHLLEGCTSSDLKVIAEIIQAPRESGLLPNWVWFTKVVRTWLDGYRSVYPWYQHQPDADMTNTLLLSLGNVLANAVRPPPVPPAKPFKDSSLVRPQG